MTQDHENKAFQIVALVRDKNGVPTGKKRELYGSDSAEEFASYWDRNNGQFWEEHAPETPFLMAQTPPVARSNKKSGPKQAPKYILLKKLEKFRKFNKTIERENNKIKSGSPAQKIVSEKTLAVAENIVNSVADLIRVKVRILNNKQGAIIMEFNSYDGDSALEFTILQDEVSYNFWNGVTTDQEYSDYKKYDRKKVRQLVEKFNSGLKR